MTRKIRNRRATLGSNGWRFRRPIEQSRHQLESNMLGVINLPSAPFAHW